MTDRALIEKKLASSVSAVSDLRRLARVDQLRHDVREERFIEHTLQIAMQAALDAASHIVSDESLGEPQTNGTCSICSLAQGGSNVDAGAGLVPAPTRSSSYLNSSGATSLR